MNILFFLTPKSEVAHIHSDNSLEKSLRKMEAAHYAAVPITDQKGHYVGTITEGDILSYIRKNAEKGLDNFDMIPIMRVDRRMDNEPVSIDANIEDLVGKAMVQNFIPVVDDNEIFIGIITRRDIIEFCYDKMKRLEGEK